MTTPSRAKVEEAIKLAKELRYLSTPDIAQVNGATVYRLASELVTSLTAALAEPETGGERGLVETLEGIATLAHVAAEAGEPYSAIKSIETLARRALAGREE